MACHMGSIMHHAGYLMMENEVSESSCITAASCNLCSWCYEPSFGAQNKRIDLMAAPFLQRSVWRKRGWKVSFALDTGGVSENGDQEGVNGDSSNLGRTRLGRIVSAGGRQLLTKLNSARKNLPMKIFLVLLGFYTANALATILGQTGDWDVLVAGIVVAAIEGIGMLMYRKLPSLSKGRLQSFVVMVNYWKAGVCLGLFVDAFKLGS
ncbi:hypothetical protein CsatB_029436 [Cannabis sativa]|uniref:Ycf20-like protein n=1 Tax=Cannabis sativa TaxID=3483 RepID=A0A7J6HKT0_CANSA|nr:hypothetical protein F8388_018120 [Cannabis sativa]